MLAIAGDHVRLDELPADVPLRYRDYGVVDGPAFDGEPTADFTVRPDADPRQATREEGERILGEEVRAAAEQVRRELERLGVDVAAAASAPSPDVSPETGGA